MPDTIALASPSLLPGGSEWNFENIAAYDAAIGKIAAEYGLDTYPNQIEVISSEQMMDAYSSVGMPIGYHHWSFGKQFIHTSQNYQRGRMGLAYEIVINSNPCIAYLMEENTLTMQALVIAHACYGHNSFFKGNYLFRTWTDADSIIDYLVFARQYITKCEERFGTEEVEKLLDSCHALMNHGVDRYQRPYPLSAADEQLRQKEREEYLQKQVNDLWRTIPLTEKDKQHILPKFPSEPQENILYFLEKNAPLLEPWQREIVRIVRKLSQYFYPQRQTQVMNEGWATFWHYTLLQTLYERQQVSDGFMLEFLQYHTSVLRQPEFDSPYYSGINPYTLGFHMMSDIRRICEDPTEEDRRWFPDIAGSPWVATLQSIMKNYKDESFIQQFLSPQVIRDLKLFAILDDEQSDTMLVAAIHDDDGYKSIRAALSAQYNLGNREPNIEVDNVDIRGDRSLTLTHRRHNAIPLDTDSTKAVLKHLQQLWGFDVHLHSMAGDDVVSSYSHSAAG
jgi:stage V sporulation protein R